MRVAIVNKYVDITGGADRHCRGLAEILQERGHEVAFVSTMSSHDHGVHGVWVPASVTHHSRTHLSLREQAAAAAKALWNPQAAAAMRNLIDDFRPDVVHAHKLYPQLSVAPIVAAAHARVPVVQTLHDFELVSASALDARGGWRDRDESRFAYRLLNTSTRVARRRVHVAKVAAFVSVSRYVARVYESHGIESTVLPNFLPALEAPKSVPTFAERQGIVFVGRLRLEKGVSDVVALAERLPAVRVTIVGSGILDSYVAEHAARLDNLSATGFLDADAIDEIVRSARLVVVPSRWQEPGPLTPIETMAQGTPVVAYANGGLAEYVADAGGGRVVPSDVDSLVRTCAELHSDADTWSQLSRRALTAVKETHSRALYAERIEGVYDRVV
jgi:glycosyltransferase involved in cell wall biosynthesis